MTDQAKANRGDRRPKKAAGHTLQHKSDEDRRQARPKCEYQGTDDHNARPDCYYRSFGADFVQQLAARKLAKQCSHATCREHKAYLGLRPFLIGEISGDVGAETCQHRSEEKIDAVETLRARIGSRDICSTKGTRRDRHMACFPPDRISKWADGKMRSQVQMCRRKRLMTTKESDP